MAAKKVVAKRSKQSKRRITTAAAIKRTHPMIRAAYQPLYAIEDIGKALTKGGLDINTAYQSVSALCDKARASFAEALDALAAQKHLATPFLHHAADSLDKAEYVVQMADAEMERTVPPRLFNLTVGAALLAFVSEAGRWMERAEMALGQDGRWLCGWLSGLMHVEGVDADYFSVLDDQEKWMIRYVHPMKQDQRQQVADAIEATHSGRMVAIDKPAVRVKSKPAGVGR